MKNLIIVFLFAFLLLPSTLLSQYSLPIRLVNSSGAPHTGQAGNITFTRYPHVHGVDNVSGLTITEIGTAGNYRCKGFTTYEYVKLWLSGVEQTWFDSVQVGNIATWLNVRYPRLSASNTYTGLNSFTNDVGFSDNVDITAGNTTIYHPLLGSSSDWLTDYSLLSTRSLIFKAAGDSLYGNGGKFFYTGGKLYLHSGIKLWGLGLTQPIQINTTQFDWDATDGLELDNPVQFDSLTVAEDTIIDEGTKRKMWSIHRNHFNEIDSMRLWMTYYNTYANTRDSFQIINNKIDLEDNVYARTVDSIAVSPIDTFSFPSVGLWDVSIHFEYEFEYVTPNNTGYDSLFVAIYHGEISEDDKVDYATYKMAFNSTVPVGFRNRSEMTFTYHITPGNIADPFYIGALTSGICHTASGSPKVWIKRNKVEITKIR